MKSWKWGENVRIHLSLKVAESIDFVGLMTASETKHQPAYATRHR